MWLVSGRAPRGLDLVSRRWYFLSPCFSWRRVCPSGYWAGGGFHLIGSVWYVLIGSFGLGPDWFWQILDFLCFDSRPTLRFLWFWSTFLTQHVISDSCFFFKMCVSLRILRIPKNCHQKHVHITQNWYLKAFEMDPQSITRQVKLVNTWTARLFQNISFDFTWDPQSDPKSLQNRSQIQICFKISIKPDFWFQNQGSMDFWED